MSQKKEFENHSQRSTSGDPNSFKRDLQPLLLPDLESVTYSISKCTDSPPPPPPSVSDNDDLSSPSVDRDATQTGAPPPDTVPEFGKKRDAQETLEELFPAPCEYGEPIRPQNLVLDFTPIKGVDDDAYNVKKVLDFWRFIRSIPELESLRASPGYSTQEKWHESEHGEDITREESEYDESEKSETIHNAKSAIPWMKCDHVMSTAFGARQRGRNCEQGGGDYFAPQPPKINKKSSPKPGTSHASYDGKQHSEGIGYPSSSQASATQPDVHTLCKQLDEWDYFNPRKLEPPTTLPTRGYNDAVLQRKT